MWARRTILLLAAASWLGGCKAEFGSWAVQTPPEPQTMNPTPPDPQATPTPMPGDDAAQPAGPEEVKAFEAAVDLVTGLQYEQAAAQLKPLVERFAVAGLDRYAGESLFWLGYCSERMKDPAKAKAYYMRAVYGYPATPAARQARARLESLEPD